MKSKLIALTLLTVVSNSLFGFLEFDRGHVFLETTFQATHDDNITGNAIGDSDLIFLLDPTLSYERKSGKGSLSASAGVSFLRYNDFDQFDSENIHADLNLDFPVNQGSRLSGGIDLGYNERTEVDEFVNDLILSENTNVNLNGQYQIRPRVAVTGRIGLNDRDTNQFSDVTDEFATIGLLINEIWQDVGITIDYRKRNVTSSGDIGNERDDKDDSISLGVIGQILPEHLFPKLDAFASFSFQTVETERNGVRNKEDVLGYNGGISWEARPTTNVELTFNRDVNVSVLDESIESSIISFGIQQRFSQLVEGGINVYFRDSDYLDSNRNDERFGIGANLQAQLGRNWTAGGRVSYDEGDSTRELSNYDRLTTSVFTSFRF